MLSSPENISATMKHFYAIESVLLLSIALTLVCPSIVFGAPIIGSSLNVRTRPVTILNSRPRPIVNNLKVQSVVTASPLSTRKSKYVFDPTKKASMPRQILFEQDKKLKIVKCLGQGGFASTYKAIVTNRNQFYSNGTSSTNTTNNHHGNENNVLVAVKVSARLIEEDRKFARSRGFPEDHERRILERLGEFKGEIILNHKQYLVMTYHEGINILNLLVDGTIKSKEELAIYRKAAEKALKQLHNKKIIHNDISPDNVLFSINKENGQVKATFIDFGYAIESDEKDYKIFVTFADDKQHLHEIFMELEQQFFGEITDYQFYSYEDML